MDLGFAHPRCQVGTGGGGESLCQPLRGSKQGHSSATLSPQHQQFNYTWLRLIQHRELCVCPASSAGTPGLRRCHGRSRSLTWLHRSLVTSQPHMVSERGPARPNAGPVWGQQEWP